MPSLFRRLRALWKKDPPLPEVSAPAAISSAPVVPAPAPAPSPQHTEPLTEFSPVNEATVYQALRKCRDPEIPVNIVDLGLIYDVQIDENLVNVKMTLTTQGCGMGGYISQEAEEQIRALPGVRDAKVEIVWDPPWNPSMISDAGRKVLGLPE